MFSSVLALQHQTADTARMTGISCRGQFCRTQSMARRFISPEPVVSRKAPRPSLLGADGMPVGSPILENYNCATEGAEASLA